MRNSQPDTYYLELSDPKYLNSFSDEFQSRDISLHIIKAKSGIQAHVGVLLVLNFPKDSAALLQELRELDYVVIAIPQSL